MFRARPNRAAGAASKARGRAVRPEESLPMTKSLPAAVFACAVALGVSPVPAGAADAAKGKTLYEQNCVSCHGVGGKGDGPTGQALAAQGTPARDFTKADFKFDADKDGQAGTDADLAAVIKNGAGAYGGSPLMAPWSYLGDGAIADLVAYIRTFHP
jgi:mono/diheme cytochrome c family protein